jgi:hypothetical protein
MKFSWALASFPKYELSSRPERSEVEGPAVLSISHRMHISRTGLQDRRSLGYARDCQVPRHPLQNVTGHPLHFCGQQFGIQMEVSVGFVGAAGYQQPQSGLWGSGNRFSVSTSP